MKRNQRESFQFNVKEYEFLINLESIQSSRPLEGIYTIDLDKGCKNLYSINEPIIFDKGKKYIFQKKQLLSVRAYKQKSMNFSWSLYKYEDEMHQFVDIFNMNFYESYNKYVQEIKNLSFQYSRLHQQRQLGQQLGRAWILMKMHLKNHQFRQCIKNSIGDIFLQFSVNIKNEFDRITEAQGKKTSKISEPEVQVKSTSSKNSLKEKKKVKFIDEQVVKEKEHELKIDSFIKVDHSEHENHQQANQQKEAEIEGEFKTIYPPLLPIQAILQKSKTILSDIIQASNQGQSHMNSGNRSDRRPSQCMLEPPLSAKTFTKTKTYHFENAQQEDQFRLKRNNSYQNFRRKQEEEIEQNYELIRVSEVSEPQKDELTQETTFIPPESISEQPNSYNIKKRAILILIIYIVLGGLLCWQIKGSLNLSLLKASKKDRILKDQLSMDKLF